MNRQSATGAIVLVAAATMLSQFGPVARAADVSGAAVKESIERGKKFLVSQQGPNGSWDVDKGEVTLGVTSMALMALINSGMTAQDVPVKRGLQYLRAQRPEELGLHYETYQVALMIMALAAAKDGKTDVVRISSLAQRLEQGQITQGNSGGWSYTLGERLAEGGGDPSNSQFAVLGLREAVEMGAVVNRETWQRAQDYWARAQNGDGGWSYSSSGNKGGGSYGSMTVAGVASLAICEQMLRTDVGVAADGTPPCCDDAAANEPLERGLNWLGRNLAMGHNPGGSHGWLLYYIYGVERAGRLSGQRFFGDHDWYREGTAYLVALQNGITGHWVGTGAVETHPVLGTSMALLFLSKGMAPVLINKLKYGPRDPRKKGEILGNDWNRHRRDVRNLTELICGLPKWPKLMTSQDLDIARAVESGGVASLLQAPVLFITGHQPPQLKPEEIKLLKEYLQEGGFIFATPNCNSSEFEAGFRALVQQIMPPGEGELKRLTPDHPVFRSEYLLDPAPPLLGVDFGCRTSIIYAPEDLGCYWEYWARQDPPNRNINLKARIIRATQIGINVMAYATGREPPAKTDAPQPVAQNADLDKIERGLLQIAQIRHDGSWNAAPRALRSLLLALNETASLAASTKTTDLVFSDPNLFQYPIIYMHGRNRFSASPEDRQQLRKYLERGNVLFADACCGARPFDASFREFIDSLYPGKKLERIKVDHELFSEKIGHDIKRLKRRTNEGKEGSGVSSFVVRDAEPFLEGLEVDGRLAVIYSKYDISCALERQSSGHCEGYLPEDAVKLALNIVLYSLAQELRLNAPDAPEKKTRP